MDLQLTDKIALVTGASMGIGRGIAMTLTDEGCKLAIVARRKEPLDEVAAEIEARGHERPLILIEDITKVGAAERIKTAVIGRFGRLDILVNNAGGSRPFKGYGTREEWNEGMNLNFHAGRDLTHAFLDGMRERKFGRIFNLTGSTEPPAHLNAGVPPNGAVQLWAKALSRVVGRDGVTVNCLSPGRIRSEQIDNVLLPSEEAREQWVAANIPVGYIGEPEDLAVLVAFLSSPKARYITGQLISVDGGARRATP
jgi:3-oxoacyl-[acyl-carrier protein] reductase